MRYFNRLAGLRYDEGMADRHKFSVSIYNFTECVLGMSDIGWSTVVEAESESEAFQLGLAEAVSASEIEGLPPHGIKKSEDYIRRHLFVRQCPADRSLISGKFFRIMVPPREQPGFMVGEYLTLDFKSHVRMVRNSNGSVIFATIEDARNALPPEVQQVPSKREYQFVELWEVPDGAS